MKTKTEKTPIKGRSRNVVMVTYPDAHILDVVGPIEILTGTKLFVEQDFEPYVVTVVADSIGPVPTTCGLTLQADQSFASAACSKKPIDILIIAGGHGTHQAMTNQSLLDFIRQAAKRAERIVSICTGAMLLAEAGLLNGRRATTHWFWCPELTKKYPEVCVEADALFIRDGNIWTSAGVTAGMDLSLALIEEDWGHDIALQIARYNVMFMMRPGGQTQFSAQLIAQQHVEGPMGKILDYITHHVSNKLTVSDLASQACMSERSFARKFKAATKMTPAQYVEIARLQAARVALEQSNELIERIACRVGFQSPERMRRAFQRHLGISATDYRQRFQAQHIGSTSLPITGQPRAGPD